jgi:hypothetical protein
VQLPAKATETFDPRDTLPRSDHYFEALAIKDVSMITFLRARGFALAAILASSSLAAPLLVQNAAAAAESRGRTFDNGVFVDNKRYQVANVPIAVAHGQTVRIQGWVLDAQSRKPGNSLLCSVDGATPHAIPGYPLPRPDVAAAQHDPDASRSGFELAVKVDDLSAGVHRFHFVLMGPNASTTPLPTDVQLAVRK